MEHPTPALEPEEIMMFSLSSRMKLHTSLLLAAFAIASSAALPTPAAAAKQSDVLAACKRTPHCIATVKDGDAYGCSPHACFVCSNGKCQQVRSTVVEGLKNKSRVGNAVGTASSASGTEMSVNGNAESASRNQMPISRPLINNPGSINMQMSGKH
jgi:hypothetical protein